MIKNIRYSNFYSFAEEATIDFGLGKKPTPSGYDIKVGEDRYNKAIAVVGANGAGKTQSLKPLAFLSWFVTQSFLNNDPNAELPCKPHLLRKNDASKFELEFRLNEEDFRYQLTIQEGKVQTEGLYKKTSTQYSYLFKRERMNTGYSFKQKGFHFPKAQAERTRTNASLLGAANSYDIAEAKPFVEFFEKFSTNVIQTGRSNFQSFQLLQVAETLKETPELLSRVSDAMCQFDLGLTGVDIRMTTALGEGQKEVSIFTPFGLHQSESGESFELPFFEESSGTQSAFVLLEPILRTLHQGGIAVIDELDNDLHPHLVPHLLEWFEFEHTNPHQAQIVFTCHTPELLNLLQKHQIYLVEKRDQRSESWRLDEMTGLRADDNLYAKYMAGALGATPEL